MSTNTTDAKPTGMSTKEMICILQAFDEGKSLEVWSYGSEMWRSYKPTLRELLAFLSESNLIRIKLPKLHGWAVRYTFGGECVFAFFTDKEKADAFHKTNSNYNATTPIEVEQIA